jgi:hypothetical protein
VENLSDERNQREINSGNSRSRHGVGQAALEDDIHVHQAVTNDGVAEAERNQHQT